MLIAPCKVTMGLGASSAMPREEFNAISWVIKHHSVISEGLETMVLDEGWEKLWTSFLPI